MFIGLDSPERSIERIRGRVALGGHGIPEQDVRRRYSRSIDECGAVLRLADRAEVYDNSTAGHRLILIARAGTIVWHAQPMPAWAERLLR